MGGDNCIGLARQKCIDNDHKECVWANTKEKNAKGENIWICRQKKRSRKAATIKKTVIKKKILPKKFVKSKDPYAEFQRRKMEERLIWYSSRTS